MINADEMIETVRAGFAPEADAAAKQRAAAVLRAALAFLEPTATPAPSTAPAPAAPTPSAADLLAAVIDRFKPFLPAEAAAGMPRLSIPLVPVAR